MHCDMLLRARTHVFNDSRMASASVFLGDIDHKWKASGQKWNATSCARAPHARYASDKKKRAHASRAVRRRDQNGHFVASPALKPRHSCCQASGRHHLWIVRLAIALVPLTTATACSHADMQV